MFIKHLEQKDQTYRNITLNGITVKAFLNGLANAGSKNVDFSKCVIKVILTRDDAPHVIAQDNLKVLGLASTLGLLNQSTFSTDANVCAKLNANQSFVSFTIPFGGHINLRNSDNIYIEVQNYEGLFLQAELTNSSYLEIKPLQSVGVERWVPCITTKVISAQEASNQYMLGDNVNRLAILNFDKTSFQENVINTMAFSSDRLNINLPYADLIAMKLDAYGKQLLDPELVDISSYIQEDQSFLLCDFNQEFDALQLDVQFNSPNVNAGKNYIVFWTYTTNWTIIDKANATDQKHMNKAVAKLNSK